MPILSNPKYELFAQSRAQGLSASAAYVMAGYKKHDSNAARLSRNEQIVARVAEIMAEGAARVGVTVQSIVEELCKIGFANIADYVDVSGESPRINLTEVPREKLAALQEITTETIFESRGRGDTAEVRRVKIKLWDKKGALVDLARHLGMFTEKLQHSNDPANPMPEKTVIVLPSNGRD